jgi:hypothetical protein
MSSVTETVKDVAAPVTKPLTSKRPGFAAFAIGGFAAPAIDTAAVNIAGRLPPFFNNPLAVGFAELAGAYLLSRNSIENEYLGIAKTGVEVGAAVAGARNIVIAGQNFINSRRGAKITPTQRGIF